MQLSLRKKLYKQYDKNENDSSTVMQLDWQTWQKGYRKTVIAALKTALKA